MKKYLRTIGLFAASVASVAFLLSAHSAQAVVSYPPAALLQPGDITNALLANNAVTNAKVSTNAAIDWTKFINNSDNTLGFYIGTDGKARLATATADQGFTIGTSTHFTKNLTVDGTCTGCGGAAPIGSDGSDSASTTAGTETLTRDMYFTTFEVLNGGVVNTGGYRIFCTISCTVDSGGKIQNNGGNGGNGNNAAGCVTNAGGTAGAAAAGGTLPGGNAGGVGGQGGCGAGGAGGNGTATTFNLVAWNGQNGGGGGNSSSGAGSGGTGGATSSAITSFPRNAQLAFQLWDFTTNTGTTSTFRYNITPGAGGGGAGGNTSSCSNAGGSGGGGGGSGGMVWINARNIVNNGTIAAQGGTGGNGGNGTGCSPTSGGGGGGAGGNGGVVFLLYGAKSGGGSVSVAGGTGGTAGTGGSGDSGAGPTGKTGVEIDIYN